MLEAEDFLALPYTPDLNWAGIAYVCRMLAQPARDTRNLAYPQLRQIVAEKAATLALVRYLEISGVRFEIFSMAPFTDPNRSDILIAGRRCEIRCSLYFQKSQFSNSTFSVQRLFNAVALVPKDRIANDHLSNEEVFIFSVISATRCTPAEEGPNPHAYLLYTPPESWSRPRARSPLGNLRVLNNSNERLSLEMAGYRVDQESRVEVVKIPPNQQGISGIFYDYLIYLHPDHIPDGAIMVHSSNRKKALTILPLQWGNIWVYGTHLILCGYITIGEIRRRMQLRSGIELENPRTRLNQQHFRITIRELHPLSELFTQAQR